MFEWLKPQQPRIRRLKEIQSEAQFLAGRHSKTYELVRVFRIAIEFIRGFRALHRIGPAVTIFGSARFKDGSPYYELARKMGAAFAREGFTVMTGGGPGIMEAANRGAKETGGQSVGCNILLPQEQGHNPYLDIVVTFYYFFVRKVMLIKYSYAYIIMPGGFGTLDEMTEALTLIQTGKLYDFPVILVDPDYWKGMLEWFRDRLLAQGAVSPGDLDWFRITNSPDEAVDIVKKATLPLGLQLKPIR